MVRTTANGKDEPEQMSFELPSEKEHLFQVVDVDEDLDPDPDIVYVKCEVVGGDEEGRSLLQRLSLDDGWKGFFATRLFLKAIGEQYKGEQFPIDSENWIGRQFFATVKHTKGKEKTYANIDQYNFEKLVEQKIIQRPTQEKNDAGGGWDDNV